MWSVTGEFIGCLRPEIPAAYMQVTDALRAE
jgi:hypothetical protein